MTEKDIYNRYQRQIILPGFGEAAQHRLGQAKVLVIGAGGLGCSSLAYLTAAGVGTIGIVDDDRITLSNLHRQVLYGMEDIGSLKATTACRILQEKNPGIQILAFAERMTTQNALEIISRFDVVIDGSDNFATRYMVNDACVLLGKPLVYGAVSQFEGQVGIFNLANTDGRARVNYRDLFPELQNDTSIKNCAEAGVLGVLPGIIGTMQANEAIKLITGIGESLANRLLHYDALRSSIYEITIMPGKNSHLFLPKDAEAFRQTPYNVVCDRIEQGLEIEQATFKQLLSNEGVTIIDIREVGEIPLLDSIAHIAAPLSQWTNKTPAFPGDSWICVCQTGKRSATAAKLLFDTFGATKKIYSLKGGLLKWIEK